MPSCVSTCQPGQPSNQPPWSSEKRRLSVGRSKLAFTMIVSIANGSHGYIPTLTAFSHGGYEPRFALPSRLEEDAGEMLTEAAIRLLQQLAS